MQSSLGSKTLEWETNTAFDVALEFKGPACFHTGGEAAAPRRSVDVTVVLGLMLDVPGN